jgi:predicted class III extradiol MEMO1 family dioxygenase
MRAAIEFEVLGSTLPLMLNEARKSWKDLMEDIDAEIPSDAEIHIVPHAGSDYSAKVFVRMKIDNAEQ